MHKKRSLLKICAEQTRKIKKVIGSLKRSLNDQIYISLMDSLLGFLSCLLSSRFRSIDLVANHFLNMPRCFR